MEVPSRGPGDSVPGHEPPGSGLCLAGPSDALASVVSESEGGIGSHPEPPGGVPREVDGLVAHPDGLLGPGLSVLSFPREEDSLSL